MNTLVHTYHPFLRHNTRGFTLVEMMVAIAVSALLLLGLVEIFGSNKAGNDLQQGLARLQENARYANFVMARHIRAAGYTPLAETLNPNLDFGLTINSAAIPPPIFTANDGTGLISDDLQIIYYSDQDCFGQPNPVLDTSGRNAIWRKEITFEQINQNLVLTCGYGSSTTVLGTAPVVINRQPVLSGVEAMQIQYGIDSDGDLAANHYQDIPSFNIGVTTVSVRVGLIVSTDDPTARLADVQPINLLGEVYPATNDRRIRRPVIFTVHMRNTTP